jgi:hypothetical protein
MFRKYQHEFSLNHLDVIRDTNKEEEIYRRCSYTYEHKLAAINMVTTT